MRIARFIVLRRPAHQPAAQRLDIKLCLYLPGGELFDKVQQGAAVSIGHFQQRLSGLTGQRQCRVQFFFSALAQQLKVGQSQSLKHQDLRSRQNRSV